MVAIKGIANFITLAFTLLVVVFGLPGLYAFMMIAEKLSSNQLILFISANIAAVIISFLIRTWLGALVLIAWPIIIFQIYSNFFYY